MVGSRVVAKEFLSSMAAHPKGTSYGDAAASPSGRSTQRQGDKRSAPQGYLLRGTAADVIASHAPLREGRHTARQNGPKHYPQGIQGDRNPLGTPFSSIFRRAAKDGVPEGRWKSRAAGKYVKQKDYAPKGVGKVERQVNS